MHQAYKNVMELLVEDEINNQFNTHDHRVIQYVNKVEVATYALNRLPCLYASSEKGKNQQKLIGYKQYRKQITIAVRQGIAAVQRDPLRISTPLISEIEEKYQIANAALRELEILLDEHNLLDYPPLSWENIVGIIQRALNKMTSRGIEKVPKSKTPLNYHDNHWQRRYYPSSVSSFWEH